MGLEEIPNDLKKMWERRKHTYYEDGNITYWMDISDGDENMEDADKGKGTFTKLPVTKAYRLLELYVNPLEDSVSRTREGSFSFEIPRNEVDQVLKINSLEGVPVKFQKHKYNNRTRGTVFHSGTIDMTDEEILNELKSMPVVKVVKKTYYNKEERRKVYTGELVLTFDLVKLPKTVDIAWLKRLEVLQYVPKPLQCNTCLTFNIKCFEFQDDKMINKCVVLSIELCSWCLKAKHLETGERNCKNTVVCRNCETEGEHPSWSKNCPVYLRELEIRKIKEVEKVSFKRAKEIVEGKHKNRKITAASVVAGSLEQTKKENDEKIEEIKRVYEEKIRNAVRENDEMWENRFYHAEQNWQSKNQSLEEKIENMNFHLQSQIQSLAEMMKQVIPNLPWQAGAAPQAITTLPIPAATPPFQPSMQTAQTFMKSPTLHFSTSQPQTLQLPTTVTVTPSISQIQLSGHHTKQLEKDELRKLSDALDDKSIPGDRPDSKRHKHST